MHAFNPLKPFLREFVLELCGTKSYRQHRYPRATVLSFIGVLIVNEHLCWLVFCINLGKYYYVETLIFETIYILIYNFDNCKRFVIIIHQ